ncbi:MAG: tetratricopeptide repeat protein [Elusimicrobiota bacterium]|jgi:tetratricopeptide (TPR) repeat protein/O-antigen ligase
MDRATARLTSRILSFGLPLLYLFTSISFYLHTYDSAQVKITIVQMFGTLVTAFWYMKLICERDVPWRKYAPLAVPLLASLVSGLLSFSHTPYPGPSIDETLRRVFYIHFALIALIEINTLERLRRMILYLLIAVAVAVLYGLVQFLDHKFFPAPTFSGGLDPFVWRQAFGQRVFSTFGNPNFFGNFLVILTPVTLALILKRSMKQPLSILLLVISSLLVSGVLWQLPKLLAFAHLTSWSDAILSLILIGFSFWVAIRFSFLGLLFFLITLCNVVTESKGAWIGYSGGMTAFFVLMVFYFAQFRFEGTRRAIQRAVVVTLLVCVIGVTYMSRQRVDSLRFRICTWVSTWEMGLQHPVWGNGVGSFRVLYPAFRRPHIFHIEGKHNTETDHSENEYWEVFQDEGVIGFGIFIWVITTFSLLGARALRRFTEGQAVRDVSTGKRKMVTDPRAFYMLGILAAFWGMLIHNLMDVSLRFVSSGIFLWLLAGLIGAMVLHDPLPDTDAAREKNESNDDVSAGHPPALITLASAISAVLFGLFTYRLFVQFSDTQGPFPDPLGEQLLWTIAWAAVLATVATVWGALYRISRSLKIVYPFLVLWATLPPLYLFWGYFMADVYHNRGIFYSKQGNWSTAIDNYKKVVELNPNYIMAYYFMGNVYTDRWQPDDLQNALAAYGQAWRIAPNYVQSHHQAGLVFLKKGQDERNRSNTLQSQPGARSEAIQSLEKARNYWEQALVYFHKYHGLDPVFEPNYTRMGWVHMQLAEIDTLENKPEAAQRHYDAAEIAYKESLGAWVCGSPGNNMMHEDWDRTHRHWSAEMFENLGNARFVRGRLSEAAKAYQMSLWRDKTNIRVMKNLASVYQRLGRQQDMTRLWNRMRALAPQDPDVQRVFHGTIAPPRS